MQINQNEYDDKIITRLQIVTEYFKSLLTADEARDANISYYGFDNLEFSIIYKKTNNEFILTFGFDTYTNHADLDRQARVIAWNILAGHCQTLSKILNKEDDWFHLGDIKLTSSQFEKIVTEVTNQQAYAKLKGEL